MINISDAIEILRPGSKWTITGNVYSNLNWLELEDGQTKPTEEEVVQKIAELEYQE